MESRKRKALYRSSKSTSLLGEYPYSHNLYEDPSVLKFFKSPRLQMQSCQMRNSSTSFQSSYRRNTSFLNSTIKPLLSPEDMAEIERRKKLRDTASKILRKIKTTVNKDSNGVSLSDGLTNGSNTKDKVALANEEPVPDKGSSGKEKKPKRIAHSLNKSKLCGAKKLVTKTVKANGKSRTVSGNYELNKAAVKDFQNRIQHKLINEIMQMPRENLQNMLNDPKINPLMQVKISHLVKENRHLIAQKLRAMAESKMNSKDSQGNSQFLADIDKLIDPVIETDLSVLPYDLIKQMENIFQVQFDYSNKSKISPQDPENSELLTNPLQQNNGVITIEPSDDSNSVEMLTPECWKETIPNSTQNCHVFDMDHPKIFKPEEQSNPEVAVSPSNHETPENCASTNENTNSDDLLYECSTDEDEEVPDEPECNGMEQEVETSAQHDSTSVPSLGVKCFKETNQANDQREDITTEGENDNYDGGGQNQVNLNDSNCVTEPEMKYSCLPTESSWNEDMSRNETGLRCSADEVKNFEIEKVPILTAEYSCNSVGSQTENRLVSSSTQTMKPVHETGLLYGVPVPKESTEESPKSLLQEVNKIQDVMNQLNHRRFMIFLKLARIYPHGEFVANSFNQSSFIESVTGGNDFLVDRLKDFFSGGSNISSGSRVSRVSKHKNRRKRKKDQKKDTALK